MSYTSCGIVPGGCSNCLNAYINSVGPNSCYWCDQSQQCSSFDTVNSETCGQSCSAGTGTSAGSSTDKKYENIQERNAQTLTDIQNLQEIEQGLFVQLEQGTADKSLNTEQKNALVQKINEISQIRINLYQNLNSMFSFFKENVSSVRDTLVEQNGAIEIVENELNQAKLRLSTIETEKENTLRLVQINTYYGDQYADHTSIMKSVILICIPIIILTILYNKDIISKLVYSILVVIIVVISAYYMWPQIVHLNAHDNMNYDEYTWKFNPTDTSLPPPISTTASSATNPWAIGTATCIGQECCSSDNVYNATTNQCEPLGYVATVATTATTPGSGSGNGTGTGTGTGSGNGTGTGSGNGSGNGSGIDMGGYGGL